MGTDGSETLRAGAGRGTVEAGAGNDRLFGGAGGDTLSGGAGADTFVYTQLSDSYRNHANELNASTVLFAPPSDAKVVTTPQPITPVSLAGGDKSETLYGYWGNDTLAGGAGNDILEGNAVDLVN
ncbi:hypothetical protein [Pseudomonas syringae]|uniref:hypothetical protein n=1 Tax=Pseudomonas syringae TaxID=317 RepID=UPI001EFDFA60|nr:hypothetical protein [Pseudomonas syringae]